MGFRFRKSIKLGKNFRLNFSKSGIGYSIGGKGLRYTRSANGRKTVTTSIPGTGLSYSTSVGKKKSSARRRKPSASTNKNTFRSSEQPFEIVKGAAMSKTKKQSSGAKTAVAAVAGIFVAGSIFGALGSDEDTVQYNIRSIEMSDTDSVTLELGNTWNDSDSGHLEVSVRDKDDFTEEDVTFISENEEIATIEYTRDVFTTKLYYEINAVSAGETYVYVKANEGDAISERIHVIVEPAPDAIIELENNLEPSVPSNPAAPEFPDIDVSVQSEKAMADDLKALGLFKGVSDTDYALDRAPTRIEAVVMLLRVLGKETVVQNLAYAHPFTDVPEWANPYIGYAYETGLAQGVSETEFGSGNASAAMYLTLVLRSLGYSDTDGRDFTWDDPYTLASELGVLSDRVDTENFLRGDVVTISHAALSARPNDSDEPLARQLIDAELFTMEEFNDIYYTIEELYIPETDVIETLVVPEPVVEPEPVPEPVIEPVSEPEPIVEQVLRLEYVTSPVARNATATLSAVGKPYTEYNIDVYYPSGISEADGLENKTSDASGNVSWTWKVGGRTSSGEHKIVIAGGDERIETSFVTTEN